MFFGHVSQWENDKYALAEPIRKGMEFILKEDLGRLAAGKYPIEGDSIFALVQEVTTSDMWEQKPESHRTHIDIQYLISGEEKIGVAVWSPEQPLTENLFEEKDIAFYDQIRSEAELVLLPGNYAVFFPSDIHRPCCKVNEPTDIRKVVVKIRKDLLK
jgi:biofilm protein TabA